MSEITLFEITVKADGLKDAVADINALGKAAESAEAKTERFVQKLEEKSRLMADGFTRGEASTLAYAKSLGLSNEQMQRVIKSLETIRNLSKDPFDSAIGSIRSIEAEFKRLTDRQDLVSKGIYLTSQQMREYSKIASEIRAKMEAAGDNFADPQTQARFNAELEQQRDLYLQIAAKVNDLVEQERKRNENLRETQRLQELLKKEELVAAYASQGYSARIANQAAFLELNGASSEDIQKYLQVAQAREQAARAAREQAAAARTLQEIEGRLATALDKTNSELNERGSATLYNYQKALKTLGISGEEASARLNKVRTQLAQIADNEVQGRMRDLARAVSVQMGDVAISLASGMNPLVVLLQQGDQIRGSFEQAALSSDKAKQAMVQASALIAQSIMDTAKAVGTFFVSAIQTAGEAILRFATHSATAEAALSKMRESVVAVSGEGSLIVKLFDNIGKSLVTTTGLIVSGFLVSLAAAVVALKQLSDEQTVAAKANAQFGAAFGASSEEIIKVTRSLDQFGITSSKATEVFVEIAKAGNIGKESFEGIAIAAVEAQKYVGIAVQDTVKTFSELLKDPVRILTEFGMQTGFVSQEQINLVENLIATGNRAEAQAVSVAILEKAYGDMTATAKEGMSGLDRTLIEVKSSLSEVWNNFKNSEVVAAAFKTAWQTVAVIVSEVWYVLKMTGQEIGGVAAQIAAVVRGDFKGAAEIGRMMKQDAAAARAEQDRLVQAILNGTKAQSSFSAEQRKANREAIETSEKQRRAFDEWKRKEEQLSKQTLSRQEYINAAVEKYKQSLQGAPVVQEHLNRVIKVSGEEWDKSHKKVNSALQKQKDYYSNLLSQIDEMRIKTDFRGEQELFITEAYRKQLSLLNDERFKELPKAQRERILQELNILDIKQQQAAIDKKHQEEVNKAWKETLAYVKEVDDAYFDVLDSIDNQSISLKKSSEELEFQKSLIGLSTEEQKWLTEERERSLEITKIQKELEKQILDIQNLQGVTEKEKQELIARANQNAQERIRQVNEKTAIKAAQDYYEQFKKVSDTITDIIATAIFEGGDAGAKKLKDVLKNAFKNFVINVIINPIANSITSSLFSGLGGLLGLGKVGGFAGLPFQGGGPLGLISNLSSLQSLFSGGLSSILSGFAYGTAPLSPQSIMLAMQEAGFSNAAIGTVGNMGSFFASIGPAIVGAFLGNLLSGRYSIFGGKGGGAIAPGIGSAIGAFFGPFGALAGGALGGVVNSLFGRKLKDTGIEGTFSGDTFTGSAYEFYKGGLFRSDKTKYKGLDPEIAKYLTNSFLSVKNSVKSAVASLGGAGTYIKSAIDKFTYSIKISTKGLSEQEIQQKFAEEFSKYSDRLAKEALINLARSSGEKYIDGLRKEGETYAQLLNRLATSLRAVNSVFEDLGYTRQEVSIVGAKAASDIIEAFGNIENFYSATSQYYNKYYSDEEKLANSKRKLSEEFDKLGLKVPESIEAFRKLVESQDLSTESGRKTYAALLNMAEAFDAVRLSADRISRTLKDQVTAVFSPLRDQIASFRGSVTSSIDSIRGRAIMTPDQIRSAIQGAMVTPPTTNELNAAAARLTQMSSASAQANAVRDQAQARLNDLQAALNSVQGQLASLVPPQDQFIHVRRGFLGLRRKTIERPGYQQELAEFYRRSNELRGQIDMLSVAVAQQRSTFAAAAESAKFYAQQLEAAKAALTVAQEQYASGVRQFIIDAGKSVEKLNDLRQSVIAYYESQRKLAEAMIGSATRLRDVVNAVRFGQLSRELLPSQLMAQFQQNYSMALATTDLTRAQYADRLADSLPQLSDSLRATASSREEWILATARLVAQANTVASLLEQTAPQDYQQQSLDLLGEIDRALSSIEVSAASAEKVISDAIYETGAQNLTGLRAIVATLRGESVPRFALGGHHTGGIRLVGENGPELEVTGPARYWSFSQTRRMLDSGNSAEVVEAIKALNENISMLRAEVRANVSHNAKVARILDRVVQEGDALLVSIQS